MKRCAQQKKQYVWRFFNLLRPSPLFRFVRPGLHSRLASGRMNERAAPSVPESVSVDGSQPILQSAWLQTTQQTVCSTVLSTRSTLHSTSPVRVHGPPPTQQPACQLHIGGIQSHRHPIPDALEAISLHRLAWPFVSDGRWRGVYSHWKSAPASCRRLPLFSQQESLRSMGILYLPYSTPSALWIVAAPDGGNYA